MQRSYIDYAMSVIVGRALPDVRDGLKPVHTRILYAMFDSGFRPDRGFFKCSRVVGDVMGNYHPHGDSAVYDALVRMAQPWSMRMPLIDSQGNFGSPGNDPPAAIRYTECRLAPLAMEMLRDINEDTVDFRENYDGRSSEPVVLPSRFPNLLINGSEGIAVGMATKIPPHNLREVAAGVAWYLDHFDASDEELLDALMERVKGPDFPTRGLIVGRRGIRDAYQTGRGSIVMRAVVEVEEDSRGRTCLVVRELPYQVNPDNLAQKIAELVKDGRIDEVIALIRASASAAEAQQGLMGLLEIDEIQARAILDMQLRKLAALERQELVNERDELEAKIADYEDILASPERQRQIVGTELAEIVHKFGNDRCTEIIAYDGEVADEDLIAEEDVAVTITYGGYAKRPHTVLFLLPPRSATGLRGTHPA